jgi:CheY-like chemotaxis protein
VNILLVEDDENKRNSILTFIQKTIPNAKVGIALSYRSAVDMIVNQEWGFLLLDMALPTYDITDNEDGFQTEAFAGNRILHEMKRRGINIPTVIITQFETLGEGAERKSLPELQKMLADNFPAIYRGTIFYSPGESSWMPKLVEYLTRNDQNTNR